jgi:hypothetical protein
MNSQQALVYELFQGALRLLFLVISSLFFAAMCAGRLEGVDVWSAAVQLKQNAPWPFALIPTFFWALRVPLQSWQTARYLLVPMTAFLSVFVGSLFYVRDIYHLPGVGRAFHYVFASLFGFYYPVIHVDGGKVDDEDPDDETNIEDKNVLRAIGGPGFVRIQPGNAVAFRDWYGARGIETNRLYFMRPFEMIARVVNLEDQHGHIDEQPATTSDGIRLHLKNIDYRFCVQRAERKNRKTPYPFATEAIQAISYSLSVSERGQDRWHDVVQRTVSGKLGDFISKHDLDYLTAPRVNGQDPRRELRMELFTAAVRESLRKVGAELQWMDIGHFDIDDMQESKDLHPVDLTRTKRWQTTLIGDAKTIRAFGEAKHLAYQELARAEAQAEMIMSITDALRNVSLGSNKTETLRHIFLARTAQILEALQDGKNGKGPA